MTASRSWVFSMRKCSWTALIRAARRPSLIGGITHLRFILRHVFSVPRSRHGRDAGYPTPPVQTRTCSFPASGSSVALASAQGRTLPCLLLPAGRLAHTNPIRHVRDELPFRAACFRRVLPHVVGFPHRRVLRSIRLPNRIWRAFPLPVLLRLPLPMVHRGAQVPALFRVRVSPSVPQELYTIHQRFPPAGAAGASQVLQRLLSCMPRPEDSGGPSHPCQYGWSCVAFGVR